MRAENNEFPYVSIAEQASTPANAVTATQRLFIDDADHLLYLVDETGTVTAVQQPASLSDPTTTRGDIITRDATDLIRLALGTVGKVPMSDGTDLAYSYPTGVRWTAATSMPGSPATGQRVTRTDLKLDFFYDGTRWLSTTYYRETLPNAVVGTQASSFSASFSMGRWAPWHTTYDLWLEDFYTSTLVNTTNTGAAYWSLALKKYQSDYSTSSTIATYATSGDTAGVGKTAKTAIGALLTPATYVIIQVEGSKTGSPGTLALPGLALGYRLVGT